MVLKSARRASNSFILSTSNTSYAATIEGNSFDQ
jgi:hypothetical protein